MAKRSPLYDSAPPCFSVVTLLRKPFTTETQRATETAQRVPTMTHRICPLRCSYAKPSGAIGSETHDRCFAGAGRGNIFPIDQNYFDQRNITEARHSII